MSRMTGSGAQLPVQAAAVRAQCERTAVQPVSCRVRQEGRLRLNHADSVRRCQVGSGNRLGLRAGGHRFVCAAAPGRSADSCQGGLGAGFPEFDVGNRHSGKGAWGKRSSPTELAFAVAHLEAKVDLVGQVRLHK
jgi:hypothetical protein